MKSVRTATYDPALHLSSDEQKIYHCIIHTTAMRSCGRWRKEGTKFIEKNREGLENADDEGDGRCWRQSL